MLVPVLLCDLVPLFMDEGRDNGELTKRPPSTVTKLQANADQHLEKIEGVAPSLGHLPFEGIAHLTIGRKRFGRVLSGGLGTYSSAPGTTLLARRIARVRARKPLFSQGPARARTSPPTSAMISRPGHKFLLGLEVGDRSRRCDQDRLGQAPL